jgi:hypothetical protein
MNRFLHNQWIGMLFFLLPLTSYAASYFVTPSGGGNHSGTSSGNPFSLAEFNSGKGTGGDTVFFSGTFTSTVVPGRGGTGNGGGRLTLNMSGATLTNSAVRIQINALAYLTLIGGSMSPSYNGVMVNFNPNNGGTSHDITIDSWTYTGQAGGVSLFLSLNHVYNLVVSNCTVENVGSFVAGDSTLNHDIDLTGNYAGGSADTTEQDDLIHIGDAANVTIEKCKLIGRAPANPAGKHNDIVQNYTKGGSNPGSPTNWIIRYNWVELQNVSGSGDCSFLMLQSMGGNPALKVYGNVFVGTGTVGDNGILVSRNNGGTYYLYNNTFIKHINPQNTVRFLGSGTLYAENNAGQANALGGSVFAGWQMGNGGWDYNFFFNTSSDSVVAGPHGSLGVNPLFANFGGNNFSLQSSSPLRGKGDRSIGTEFNQGIRAGSTWPNPTLTTRNTWDIGAFNQ